MLIRASLRLWYSIRFWYLSQRRALHDGHNADKVRFDVNELARVAAESTDASQCNSITKYPDGMFSKAYLLSMDDGRQVVAKVPNPKAGVPQYTTASEAKNVMDTPVSRVHTWNSRAESHPVGAEFIIMDKVEGVQLSRVWDTIKLLEKLQVVLALVRLQARWFRVSYSHCSLHYEGDVDPLPGSYYNLTLGPATGRAWSDVKRSTLDVERGPWPSLTSYREAISARETSAICSLKPPKQIAMFCGPKLYQPNIAQKLAAIRHYNQIFNDLIPPNATVSKPQFWHNDLRGDNIFVGPNNPQVITGIIDWQSCHVSPLFNHNSDLGFLDWGRLEPETLDLVPQPNLQGLSPEKRCAAVHECSVQNLFIGWRKLMRSKNPALYDVVEFRKTAAYGLIFLTHRIFEYGEAHMESLLVDLQHTWKDLPSAEVERIKRACDGAVAGTELVQEVKETLGDLWLDKELIEHERYDECKAALNEARDQTHVLPELTTEGSSDERDENRRDWAFGTL
ncbi:phosphotransferase enzyme family protein [Aspergillus venezuelensis]